MRLRLLFAARRLALALVLFYFLPKTHGAAPPEPRTAAEMAAAADPNDAMVAQIAAANLERYHYTQHPFDEEMSSKFLDRYLESLDYLHMFFLQSDISEFEQYRTKLNVLTLNNHDITPCWVIFSRFMDRVHERVDFASNLLQTATFEFTGHERFVLNRHKLPYAKDLDEAKEFWRQALRCEYLDQLLTSPDIQFTGPVSFDAKGNTVVTLTRDKMHPLSFDYLSGKYMAQDGHPIGWLEVAASQSNATLRLDLPSHENLRKTTNHLYSAKSEEVGDVTFRRERVETDLTRNTDQVPEEPKVKDGQIVTEVRPGGVNNGAAAAAPHAATSTNLEAVIRLSQKNLTEIHKTLTNHYAQMLRNYKELDTDSAFELYVNSLARAYDPHSDFMGHISAENFSIQMKLSLIGIGALLGKDDDYCSIEELKEGPAKKSGKLHEKDRIVAVAQTNAAPVDVQGMPLNKIVEMIRGAKGTQVTLTIIPHDAPDSSVRKNVTLIRDEIKLEDMDAKARLYETPDASARVLDVPAPLRIHPNENPEATAPSGRLGVINIQSFYGDSEGSGGGDNDGGDRPPKSMTTDVSNLVTRLKKENVGGIILDLRHNGGGYLEEAIQLAGLFVPPGPVVQTKDPTGVVSVESCRGTSVLYDGPLIVLTSRFSASASEILAGALQDYNRALIVGDHSTFGKGTVQTMQMLKPNLIHYLRVKKMDYDPNYDPGALKITIKKFYRAGGVSTQFNGVVSDVELPSIWNYDTEEVGESALPNALPCDEVSSANPANLNQVRPYLAALQERSRQRVAASKDFAYIQQDITEFLKQQADRSLSLNLAERQAEQKTKMARFEAIKKERLSRPKSDEKVFEITLQNYKLPQLQPPPVKTNSIADLPALGDPSDADPDADAAASEAVIDPTLEEAKHILADYIALMNKEPGLSKVP
jgi:carboxyl-terminal processing protease